MRWFPWFLMNMLRVVVVPQFLPKSKWLSHIIIFRTLFFNLELYPIVLRLVESFSFCTSENDSQMQFADSIIHFRHGLLPTPPHGSGIEPELLANSCCTAALLIIQLESVAKFTRRGCISKSGEVLKIIIAHSSPFSKAFHFQSSSPRLSRVC